MHFRYATMDADLRFIRSNGALFFRMIDGMLRYGMLRYGMLRYGTVRYGTVRYGTVRYGTLETSVRYATLR
jgi:hypothetical protein